MSWIWKEKESSRELRWIFQRIPIMGSKTLIWLLLLLGWIITKFWDLGLTLFFFLPRGDSYLIHSKRKQYSLFSKKLVLISVGVTNPFKFFKLKQSRLFFHVLRANWRSLFYGLTSLQGVHSRANNQANLFQF